MAAVCDGFLQNRPEMLAQPGRMTIHAVDRVEQAMEVVRGLG